MTIDEEIIEIVKGHRDFLDFPTGFKLDKLVVHTDPKCSSLQTKGALLCDCGAIEAAFEKARKVLAEGVYDVMSS